MCLQFTSVVVVLMKLRKTMNSCCYRDRDIVDGLWASVVRASTKHLSQREADSTGSFFGEPRKRACLRLNAF